MGCMKRESEKFVVAVLLLAAAFSLHTAILPRLLQGRSAGVSVALLGGAYLTVASILLASILCLRSVLRSPTGRA